MSTHRSPPPENRGEKSSLTKAVTQNATGFTNHSKTRIAFVSNKPVRFELRTSSMTD